MGAEDKHYYAKWGNALSYPITYVMNDSATSPASAVTPNSYTVEDADFALGIPTRNGATFLGWYDNAALSGTVTPNNVATGTPTGMRPNTAPSKGDDKQQFTEPSPQKNADTLDKGNALSQDGGKRATNRGTAVNTNKGRLPKTGEAPFALNFAGTAAGFLLAAYAVLGRKRKEQ